jgi:hypothetical protein
VLPLLWWRILSGTDRKPGIAPAIDRAVPPAINPEWLYVKNYRFCWTVRLSADLKTSKPANNSVTTFGVLDVNK